MTGMHAFDTLAFAKKLKRAGYPDAQAEALAEAQSEVFQDMLDSSLVSKTDLERETFALREDLHRVEAELKADIHRVEAELKAELKADIRSVEAGLTADIRRVEKRMYSLVAAQTALLAGLIFAAGS